MRRGRPTLSAEEIRFREQLGEQLTNDIEARGITQREFAEMIGVPRSTVNQWCTGKRAPSLFCWWKLQKAFREVEG